MNESVNAIVWNASVRIVTDVIANVNHDSMHAVVHDHHVIVVNANDRDIVAVRANVESVDRVIATLTISIVVIVAIKIANVKRRRKRSDQSRVNGIAIVRRRNAIDVIANVIRIAIVRSASRTLETARLRSRRNLLMTIQTIHRQMLTINRMLSSMKMKSNKNLIVIRIRINKMADNRIPIVEKGMAKIRDGGVNF